MSHGADSLSFSVHDFANEAKSPPELPADLVASLYDKDSIPLFSSRSAEVNVTSLDFSGDPYVSLFSENANTFPSSNKSNEVLVASLSKDDVRVLDLPFYEQPFEQQPTEQPSQQDSEQQPEQKFIEVLKDFPNNPTQEDYARAVPEVERILLDQARITESAQNDFLNYEGIDDLLVESDAQYQAVIDSLPPKLLTDQGYADRLRNLHVLVFSGHEGEAGLTLEELKGAAGGQSDTELQNYFDQLRKIAKENPEIVNEYGQLGNQYFYEWNTEQEMLKLLSKHTLGDFFFPMR